MRSFITILGLVLQNETEITELPASELVAIDINCAVPLGYDVPTDLMIKLARLQTLKYHEQDLCSMPKMESITQQAKETKTSVAGIMGHSLATQEDSIHRIIMLERLFTEIVRESFPKECERFDVTYFLHPTKGIMFRPINHRQFLD